MGRNMKCLLLLALLAAVSVAHQPHHRRSHAVPRRVDDATSTLLFQLEGDVKQLLEEEEAVTQSDLQSVQDTWFSPKKDQDNERTSTLFQFLEANFKTHSNGNIDWDQAKIRYQSGTAMASLGCRASTNDVDAWMFLDQTTTAAHFSQLGLKYVGNKNNLRKLSVPGGVELGDASKISTTEWTLTPLQSSESVGDIYRIENFPASRRGEGVMIGQTRQYAGTYEEPVRGAILHHKDASGREVAYVWGKTSGSTFSTQTLPAPSGFADVELDIYFPSKQAYKYFWEQAQPVETDTTPYVTNSVCLMMKAKDVYKFRTGEGKAFNDANDVCCMCGQTFPNHNGFQNHAQRAAFCKLMKRYGKEFSSNPPNCQDATDLTEADIATLGALGDLWETKKASYSEMALLSSMLDAVKGKTPDELNTWITQQAGREH